MKSHPRPKKKLYSVAEANATLPLLRAILKDITSHATEMRVLYQRLMHLQQMEELDKAHQEELQQLAERFERGQERMNEYVTELEKLGIELKDYNTGLVDFRHMKDGREVYLCWRLGEPEVAHWHELEAGFAGRQELAPQTIKG